MPIANDLLTGNRGGGPRVFLHLNRHATEICMPCRQILNFRDLLTRVARSLGSNEKFIPNMPLVPKSPACRAGQIQIFWHAGHTKISLRHAVNGQVSSLNLQLFQACLKKKMKRLPYLSFDVQVIGHLHDDVIDIPFIFILQLCAQCPGL